MCSFWINLRAQKRRTREVGSLCASIAFPCSLPMRGIVHDTAYFMLGALSIYHSYQSGAQIEAMYIRTEDPRMVLDQLMKSFQAAASVTSIAQHAVGIRFKRDSRWKLSTRQPATRRRGLPIHIGGKAHRILRGYVVIQARTWRFRPHGIPVWGTSSEQTFSCQP